MITACPCGGEASPLIQDSRATSFVFQDLISYLFVCRVCTHTFFFPAPPDHRLTEFYNGSWNDGSGASIDFAYAAWIEDSENEIHRPKATFLNAIQRLRVEYCKESFPVVLHDVSCGYGALVSKLNMLGFDATGSDLDHESIEQGRKRGNSRIFHSHFKSLPDVLRGGVDILTCYHSLEHYPDPLEFFRVVKRLLRPGGIFIAALPNGSYLPATRDYFGKYDWCFYPGHLHYFTPGSALTLLAKAGLRLTETFSYDWDGTQEDWLLDTASRMPAFESVPRDQLLRHLAAETLTRDLRFVAINEDPGPVSVGPRRGSLIQRVISSFPRSGRKASNDTETEPISVEKPPVTVTSHARSKHSIDDSVSILGYEIVRRNGEHSISLQMLTTNQLTKQYLIILHLQDTTNTDGSFVNLDFPPFPPTTEWSPDRPVRLLRRLVHPRTTQWYPDRAVNLVEELPVHPGGYLLRVGLWDLQGGLVGSLAELGQLVVPS
jgi:SAM-dependent methyltransferase